MGRPPIGEIVKQGDRPRPSARGLPKFRCGGAEYIRDRPAWAGVQSDLALEDDVVITLSDARRVITAAEARSRTAGERPVTSAKFADFYPV